MNVALVVDYAKKSAQAIAFALLLIREKIGAKKILNYSINFGRCIYCGLCAEVCPELAIVHGDLVENASTQRAFFGFKPQLLEHKSSLLEFGGFGSISVNADERVKTTPLSYCTQDSQNMLSESAPQENTNV